MKKLLVCILALLALMGCAALADTETVTYINPMIPEFNTETYVTPRSGFQTYYSVYDAGFISKEAAAAKLKAAMLKRATSIILYVDDTDGMGRTALLNYIWNTALAHTGVPTEGDYLASNYGGYSCEIWYSSGSSEIEYDFTLYALDSAAQEKQMNSAVSACLKSLKLDGKTDAEKLDIIYEYVTSNITYDYDNLNDDSYDLKYTPYAALVNRTAVCQGYAGLMYRLLLTSGVPCRMITGTANGGSHAWNIAKVDGYWYNLDSTWDAGTVWRCWYLRSPSEFTMHAREAAFLTSAFNAAYPMAEQSYYAVSIDEDWFPDETFRSYVSENYDTDGNGILGAAEAVAQKTYSIDLRDMGITSFKGIEHFYALQVLYCSGNELTELDVSDNRALTYLFCGNNHIAYLDLSGNGYLEYASAGSQSVSGVPVTNDETSYYIDMSALIPDITRLSGFTAGTYDASTGRLSFGALPSGFGYTCGTGFDWCVLDCTCTTKPALRGTLGTDIAWVLDAAGTLTLTGSGTMPDVTGSFGWDVIAPYVYSLVIDGDITSVSAGAFADDDNLRYAYLPAGITMIGDGAFPSSTSVYCASREAAVILSESGNLYADPYDIIYLPERLTLIEEDAFDASGARCVVIPDGMSAITSGAFAGCGKLAFVLMGENVTSIAEDAFDAGSRVIVVAPDGSYAASWCEVQGITRIAALY